MIRAKDLAGENDALADATAAAHGLRASTSQPHALYQAERAAGKAR